MAIFIVFVVFVSFCICLYQCVYKKNEILYSVLFDHERLYSPVSEFRYSDLLNKRNVVLDLDCILKSPYGFYIVVPYSGDWENEVDSSGLMKYRIITNGVVTQRGVVEYMEGPSIQDGEMAYYGMFYFDLPVEGEVANVKLHVVLDKPFESIEKNKENAICMVRSSATK